MFIVSVFNQDISNWDVSSGTNFGNMFSESSFNQDIGNWDVSSGTQFYGMFAFTAFNHDISNWDVSSGTNFGNMFNYTSFFNQDIGNWNVSSEADIDNMFIDASAMLANQGVTATPDRSYFVGPAKDDGDASFSITEKVTATYYNTSTHQVQTLDQMLAAGWLELSEASYGDTYQYPAIYSNGVISDENGPIRQALDLSVGDQVGDWIVASSGNGITITEDSADPDGTGTLSYSWESSDDGNTGWTEIYTSANYTITSADEGKHVRAVITYTDDEGFSETVTTSSMQILRMMETHHFR